MGCKAPLQATRDGAGAIRLLPRSVQGTGLTHRTHTDRIVELPCGRCAQCRVKKAQEWALRCTHEAKMHRHQDGSPNGAFITLTFENEGLQLRELREGIHPSTVHVRDWQLFAKKLRKAVGPFRYFAVGEYGDENLRPHYHALLFGQDFTEDRIKCEDRDGKTFYLSDTLQKTWGYGLTDIRPITPETVNYVCRYVTKKLSGDLAESALERLDPETGEVTKVRPVFAVMSKGKNGKGGIGASWFDRFRDDVFPDAFVIQKGKQKPVPRYYTKRLKDQDPELHAQVLENQTKKARKHLKEQTPERRRVKEQIVRARLKQRKNGKI